METRNRKRIRLMSQEAANETSKQTVPNQIHSSFKVKKRNPAIQGKLVPARKRAKTDQCESSVPVEAATPGSSVIEISNDHHSRANQSGQTMDVQFTDSNEMQVAMKNEYDYFNNFPDELLVEIFRHLTTEEKCIAGRACRSFYRVSRLSEFWKKVDVTIKRPSKTLMKFVEKLPNAVSSLRLCFRGGKCSSNIDEFSAMLKKSCPNLQILILDNVRLKTMNCSHIVLHFCNSLPKSIRVLVLQVSDIEMKDQELKCGDCSISNIEVLMVSNKSRNKISIDSSVFKHMPCLRELHLQDFDFYTKPDEMNDLESDVLFPVISQLDILDLGNTGMIFRASVSPMVDVIEAYGTNLTELYLCNVRWAGHTFTFEDPSTLPRLRVLCLCGCLATYKTINALVSRLDLQVVYVNKFAINVNKYDDFDYSKCDSPKVNVVHPYKICKHWDAEYFFSK